MSGGARQTHRVPELTSVQPSLAAALWPHGPHGNMLPPQFRNFLFYGLLALGGLLGNTTVMAVTLQSLSKLPTADLLFVLLATCNLVNNLLRLGTSLSEATGTCLLTRAGCPLYYFTVRFTEVLAIWITLLVSVFRLAKVRSPFGVNAVLSRMMEQRRCAAAIGSVSAVLGALLHPLLQFTRPFDGNGSVPWCQCIIEPSSYYIRYSMSTVLLIFLEVLPTVLMVVTNVRTICFLRATKVQWQQGGWATSRPFCQEVRAVKLLSALVCVFLFSWGSHATSIVLVTSNPAQVNPQLVQAVRILSTMYASLSPYIIGLGNQKFRDRVFGCTQNCLKCRAPKRTVAAVQYDLTHL
ncbi:olfactory receptor class A-like protein 4 [Lampetra fluviatilis]